MKIIKIQISAIGATFYLDNGEQFHYIHNWPDWKVALINKLEHNSPKVVSNEVYNFIRTNFAEITELFLAEKLKASL